MIKKKIILAVSSSIAAYKACDITRQFVKNGFDVQIILTKNSLELITPLTLETLSGNKVYTDLFVKENREMGHISLRENASLFLVAPATANIIGKFANGIADDLLTTTFLSVDCPVLIAPAMNPFMYKHPATKKNIKILKEWGIKFIEPASGHVICGDEGVGKLSSIEEIFNESIKIIK
jgi:phosphopantothenoylcysteine decarboxylase